MAGLDTRTGKRNAELPPKRAEDIKQTKAPQAKVPVKTAVQAAKQSVSQSSGTTSNSTGTPQTQPNFNNQQALMMDRAR